MIHSFDIEEAQKYGVNSAVILHNLRFWIAKNKANDKHFYDGQYWTYNSVKAFAELFPYLSEKQIRSSLDKLEELQVIKSGEYNSAAHDRTKWYCLLVQLDLPCRANGVALEGKTVNTDSKPNNKQDKDITIDDFLKKCKETNSKPIKEFKALWDYVKLSEIPEEFILIAWHYFVDNYSGTDKKYKDWRIAFLKFVKGNYFKLWWQNNEGEYKLTTSGMQMKQYLDNRG